MTSRQRAYQIRNQAKGLCLKCPQPAVTEYCEQHRQLRNQWQNKRYANRKAGSK